MGGGVWEGRMLLVRLSAGFQSLPSLPTSKLGPSGADSRAGGLVYILGSCGSLQWTLMWGSEFLLLPPQVFSARGFAAIFPHAGALDYAVCLAPQLFLPVYLHANVRLPALPATDSPTLVLQPPPCCVFSPPQLPVSAPPTGLDECFFFNSLAVRLPYSSIFLQFWLFFLFKFVVVLLVVQWGKMYPRSILTGNPPLPFF